MSDETKIKDEEKIEVDSQELADDAEKVEQQQWDEMNELVFTEWQNAMTKEVTDLANHLHVMAKDPTFISKISKKIVKSIED